MSYEAPDKFENVECVKATAAALLCMIDGEQVWIPRSQVHDDSEVYEEGHAGRLVVTHWIAVQKGLV